jgi:ankyrin repeat protein
MNDNLAIAARNGELAEVNRLLESGYDVNILSSDGVPPLFDAAAYGHIDVIKALIAANANVNYKNRVGYTSLMAAATLRSPEALEALIEAGAEILATDNNGRNALAIACKEGSAATVACLLKHKAAIDARIGESGGTPLMWAVYNSHSAIEIIKLLLSQGADVSLTDFSGKTVVDHARMRHPDCLSLFSE